ncbi:uncharacterized protein METZ01_LOCUS249818, partial [marine metagenome]
VDHVIGARFFQCGGVSKPVSDPAGMDTGAFSRFNV